jgi:hypothetical protein
LSHGVLDAIIIDSSNNRAAAPAAVADVPNSLHHVADSMNKADLLSFVEELKGRFPRNINLRWWTLVR